MPAVSKPARLTHRLRRLGRVFGQCWLAFSLMAGGLAGPAAAAAGHDLLHDHEMAPLPAPSAHHHHHSSPALPLGESGQHGESGQVDEGCQPDPLCMAGCAHAGSALPPLRLATPSQLRPPTAAGDSEQPFRSRAPERELRPPILPLNA